MDTYATSLAQQKKYEQAEAIYRECLELRRRLLGTNSSDFLVTLGNLGQTLAERGQLAEAEQVVRDVIDRRTRAGLANTMDTFASVNNLAAILLLRDRLDEAERLLADACRRATQIFGPENPVSTLHLQRALARTLAGQGRFDEAEALAAQTLAVHRRVASSHEGTGRALLILGRVKVEKGNLDEAEPLLREALDLFREHSPSRRELIAQAANWLATVQVARKAYPEAERLLLSDPEEFLAPTAQMSSAERRAALGHIVQLYQNWRKPDQAAIWQHRLDEIPLPPAK
jgi:tetratricopeptide (TPR) repeat protein